MTGVRSPHFTPTKKGQTTPVQQLGIAKNRGGVTTTIRTGKTSRRFPLSEP